jgi:hypothetical protein
MVPTAPVRIHVQSLLDQGMRPAAIYRAARTSSAALSALLYGQFKPGRPEQQHIHTDVAARLLAVRFEAPAPKPEPLLCAPGDRFEPVGHQVGLCKDCGQIAPLYVRPDMAVMIRHPRPAGGAQEPDALPGPTGRHPDCGTPKGHQRHRREKTEYCQPCRAARRGFDQGWDAAMAKVRRGTVNAVPAPLAEAVVKACRAFVYRRPTPQLRELAVQVVRIADAELCADDAGEGLAA